MSSPISSWDSRASETQGRQDAAGFHFSLSPPLLAFLTWGDFHACWCFARSTKTKEKWVLLVVYKNIIILHIILLCSQAVSPDGEAIVTGAGDETLRFWNVFNKARSHKVLLYYISAVNMLLCRKAALCQSERHNSLVIGQLRS